MTNFAETKALTFDLFGTILDLGGSLTPFITESLDNQRIPTVMCPRTNFGNSGVTDNG